MNVPVSSAAPAAPVVTAKSNRQKALREAGPWVTAFVAVAVIVVAVVLRFGQTRVGSGEVVLGEDLRVRVEVADTVATRERGLSGHKPLADGEGMYFIFEARGKYQFWMKDMLFPIDIIWIAGNEIADLTVDVPVPVEGEPLPTYAPRVPVDRVLEVPAGYAQAHGLRLGMPVEERLGGE